MLPDESSALSVGGAGLADDGDIGEQYVPEFDFTYFFTDTIAAELILAVTPHDVSAVNMTVPGALTNATVDLGDVWLLPPTLTLQYHFRNARKFKPYVGAGVTATFFFNGDEGPSQTAWTKIQASARPCRPVSTMISTARRGAARSTSTSRRSGSTPR